MSGQDTDTEADATGWPAVPITYPELQLENFLNENLSEVQAGM